MCREVGGEAARPCKNRVPNTTPEAPGVGAQSCCAQPRQAAFHFVRLPEDSALRAEWAEQDCALHQSMNLLFRQFRQIRQTLFKLPADYFVHVHEQTEYFPDVAVLAGHHPRDARLAAFGLEGESRLRLTGHRPEELELDIDEFARLGCLDRH